MNRSIQLTPHQRRRPARIVWSGFVPAVVALVVAAMQPVRATDVRAQRGGHHAHDPDRRPDCHSVAEPDPHAHADADADSHADAERGTVATGEPTRARAW